MLWLVYLTIAIILMSLNSYLVKILVKKTNPLTILFYQYMIAIPLVGAYSLFLNTGLSINLPSIILGFVYVVGIACFYIALKKGSLSRVSPVFNMKMIMTALLGILFLSETISLKLIIGLFFGMIGVYFLGSEK